MIAYHKRLLKEMNPTNRDITELSSVRSIASLSLFLWMTLTVCAVPASDWPTYQHDVRRTGFTKERIEPSELALLWTWRSPHPPQPAWAGPAKWDAYAKRRDLPSMRSYDLAFCPIAVGDSVFFGSSTDDSVYCVDAGKRPREMVLHHGRTGTGGPIRCERKTLFRIGRRLRILFAIRRRDARLAIPTGESARKILNNGRLISPHPCRTGVLIDDGIAYFANAMLPWKDAFLCAVDAETGRAEGPQCYVRKYHGLTLEGAPAATAKLLVFPQGRVAPQVFRRADGTIKDSSRKVVADPSSSPHSTRLFSTAPAPTREKERFVAVARQRWR